MSMKAKVNVKNMFVCIFLGVLWLFVVGRMLCHLRQGEYAKMAGGALKEALLQELELRKMKLIHIRVSCQIAGHRNSRTAGIYR